MGSDGAFNIIGSNFVSAGGGAKNQLISLRFDGLFIPTDAVIVNTQIGLDAANDAGADHHAAGSFASGDFADLADYFDFQEFDGLDLPGAERHAATLGADTDAADLDPLPMDLVWIDRLDPGRTVGPPEEAGRYADWDVPFDPSTAPIDGPGEPTPATDLSAPGSDARGAVQVSTLGSDVAIATIGEIVRLAGGDAIAPLSNSSMPLINLDGFQGDVNFFGIDGSGFAAVILDTGIDLDHPFFGPDNDLDGIADRIVFQYDFADGDADASDQNGHGPNVSSIVASSD